LTFTFLTSDKLRALVRRCRASAGLLVVPANKPVPTSTTTTEEGAGAEEDAEDDALCSVAGADLIVNTPEVAHWLEKLFPDKVMVVHALVYLDGEAHVRASVGARSELRYPQKSACYPS
jgi:hypothetical protein